MECSSVKFACLAGLLVLMLLLTADRTPDFSITERPAIAKKQGQEEESQTAASSIAGVGSNSSHYNVTNKDKVFGGLIAPGFDEDSCLSRYQSVLYRKPSFHKPSPSLISRLRNYESLHTRCGPYTKPFNMAFEQLRSGQKIGSPTECKYVVWVAFSGLGNKILTMASAFLYALLTNRILLIEQEDDVANLFCEPFPNTSWLLPKGFPIRFANLSQNHPSCYGNLLRTNKGNISAADQWPPPFLYLHLFHDYDENDTLFFCENYQTPLRDVPWLIMRTDNYFIPSLFMIPSLARELVKLFPNKETVFHHLGRYLFHPSNQVWGLITRFYLAYLAKADEIVGIQIRVLDIGTNPMGYIMDQILSCTVKENLLPAALDAQKSAAFPSNSESSKAVLVTSLYPGYYEEMRNLYWTKPTTTGEVISVYQPSHEEVQQFGNSMHNMKAWSEMYLLSLSDKLVTTAWSTFGYVAQGLGGLRPWILVKPENRTTPEPPCLRAMSMEPCFHSPPSHYCKSRVKGNSSSGEVVFVRPCKDRNWGTKLFDIKI